MPTNNPTDPGFDVALWESDTQRERQTAAAEQRRRDVSWREDALSRLRNRGGPSLAPSYIAFPVPNPEPGAPRSVLVRDRRKDAP